MSSVSGAHRSLVAHALSSRGIGFFALPDPDLKAFYLKLAKAEYHHQELFEDLAMKFFPREVVKDRLNFWLDREATVFSAQDIRPAVH
ncbi:hypothetical protein EBR78_10235 [bacterium]|nr:hypothetical protein [bacterium]